MISGPELRILPYTYHGRAAVIIPQAAASIPSRATLSGMNYEEKIVDRQVGRNGDLFAVSIGEMKTIEERYPYLRILVSIVEQAHPEWNQAPTKDQQIALLVFHMSRGSLDKDEVAEIVRLRDEERGYTVPPDR